MSETLYLVIEERRRGAWRKGKLRISAVSKTRPALARPTEQALVRINVELPDMLLQPRAVNVEIKADDIAHQPISVTSSKA
jgi:hypothetical protein